MSNTIQGRLNEMGYLLFCQWRPLLLVAVLVALGMLGLGLVWPKTYQSHVTIIFDEQSIIQPLMEGTAVATDVTERAGLAREVINSRAFLNQIIEQSNLVPPDADPLQWDMAREGMRNRIRVETIPPNLIRVSYSHSDPIIAHRVTAHLAELFIAETRALKTNESTTAFEFIDQQVRDYHRKLLQAEARLKEYRSNNLEARTGSENAVNERLLHLTNELERTRLSLSETRIRIQAIEEQMAGEAAVEVSLGQESRLQARLAELQAQLAELRLSYHDTYPDIVQIRHRIEDIRDQMAALARQRERALEQGAPEQTLANNENVRLSPLYQRLRQQLSENRTRLSALETRERELESMLERERDKGRKVHTGEMVLAELTRDYEVNRDIYRDLLRRRENARVSMDLDRGEQGMTLRIYEPAFLPLKPSGLSLLHFMMLGMLLALLLPAGYLLARVQLDPRVRSTEQLTSELGYRVLTAVPIIYLPEEQQDAREAVRKAVLAGAFLLVCYAVVAVLRATGVL